MRPPFIDGPYYRFEHHGWWWHFFGALIPLLFFALLIGLIVWVVLRLSGRGFGPAAMATVPTGAVAPRRDPAIEEVRLRYARGEMSREEFVQRSLDLSGGDPRGSGPVAPPATEPLADQPPSQDEA
jgi:putative membrane protein